MNVQTAVKAAAATAAGALMLGATLAGAAMAADLGSFPTPFVENGMFKGKIVVGSGAATADVVGAIGIAAALGQQTVKLEDATGSGSAVIKFTSADGKQEDIAFGGAINAGDGIGSPIKKRDLSTLSDYSGDSELKFSDYTSETFKGQEEMQLGGTATISRNKGIWKLAVASNQVVFKFGFQETLKDPTNSSAGTNIWCTPAWLGTTSATGLGTADIDIFGKTVTLKCLGADSGTTTNKLTVQIGAKYDLSLDNPKVTDAATGAEITFSGVDNNSNKLYLSVKNSAGSSESSSLTCGGAAKTIAGLQVKATDCFRLSDTNSFGTIRIGSTVDKTLNSGDDWPDNSDWKVAFSDLSASTNAVSKPYFILQYQPSSSPTGDNSLKEGEKIDGLYGGFELKNVGFKVPYSEYGQGITVEYTGSYSPVTADCDTSSTTAYTGNTDNAIRISWPTALDSHVGTNDASDANDTTAALTTPEAKELLLYTANNGTTYFLTYKDLTGKWRCGGMDTTNVAYTSSYNLTVPIAYLKNDQTILKLYAVGGNATNNFQGLLFNVSNTVDAQLEYGLLKFMTTSNELTQVGSGKDITHTNDLVYWSTTIDTTQTGIGATEDYDYWTQYGTIFRKPDNTFDSITEGKLIMDLPPERNKLTVLLGKSTTKSEEIASGETGATTKVKIDSIKVSGAKKATVVPISVPVAVLDTEVTDKTADNLILVGGPSVNTLVKDLGYTASDFGSGSAPVGKVYMKANAFSGSKTAVVVAGWDAANTRAASWVLAHYGDYASKLSGAMSVTVTGTDVASLTVE